MNNFNDINYLVGRRMQRNHNNAISNDRAPHLKRCLKRPKKKESELDDMHLHNKNLREKALRSVKPNIKQSSNKRTRITLEPNLDIFGNDLNKPRYKFGIFANSVIGRSFDLIPKTKEKTYEKDLQNDRRQSKEDNQNLPPIENTNDFIDKSKICDLPPIRKHAVENAKIFKQPLTTLIEKVGEDNTSPIFSEANERNDSIINVEDGDELNSSHNEFPDGNGHSFKEMQFNAQSRSFGLSDHFEFVKPDEQQVLMSDISHIDYLPMPSCAYFDLPQDDNFLFDNIANEINQNNCREFNSHLEYNSSNEQKQDSYELQLSPIKKLTEEPNNYQLDFYPSTSFDNQNESGCYSREPSFIDNEKSTSIIKEHDYSKIYCDELSPISPIGNLNTRAHFSLFHQNVNEIGDSDIDFNFNSSFGDYLNSLEPLQPIDDKYLSNSTIDNDFHLDSTGQPLSPDYNQERTYIELQTTGEINNNYLYRHVEPHYMNKEDSVSMFWKSPLEQNVQKLYQIISPNSYQSAKMKIDSCSYLHKF